MIPDEIHLGPRYQGRKPLNQFEGFENHVGGAVAPAVLEAIEKPAVWQK
jgi:hypothetical protein